jgi:S-methyl-5-thioribose-1-phosphate isomerase
VRAARPTAVNLAWGVDRVAAVAAGSPADDDAAVVAEAKAVLDEDVAANTAIGERGADLLADLCRTAPAEGLRLHTHCNAGALACVDVGTALGVVRAVQARGALARVYADETRPLLQGARLTAWELDRLGVDYRVVVDGAGPSLIARGLVDAVVVGSDRVAANGDVANKIGTYPLALAAARAGIPFVVAAPESTVDPGTPSGEAITIEDRGDDEVLAWGGVSVAPAGARAVNPAFDVTPADLVTAVVTERRVVRPAAGERLA